jgi:hypothetical protein
MSPQEKAKELFGKHYIICQEYTEEIQCSIQAKQCALIAVDEVLKSQNNIYGVNNRATTFYLEVKHELEKL